MNILTYEKKRWFIDEIMNLRQQLDAFAPKDGMSPIIPPNFFLIEDQWVKFLMVNLVNDKVYA